MTTTFFSGFEPVLTTLKQYVTGAEPFKATTMSVPLDKHEAPLLLGPKYTVLLMVIPDDEAVTEDVSLEVTGGIPRGKPSANDGVATTVAKLVRLGDTVTPGT